MQKELKKNKPCPSVVSLNLRNCTFRDVDAFSYHITEELNSWWKHLVTSIRDINPKLSIADVTLEINPKNVRHKFYEALQALSKALPNWSWLRGNGIPTPILFIDEANRLSMLLDDKNGYTMLNDLL